VFQSDFGHRDRMFRQGQIIAETRGRKAIVNGEDSLLFAGNSAEYIRECGARDLPIIGIPGARHHLMLDEPRAFVSVLRTLLAQWGVQPV
jgi:pimeloyl-ACP methyl ester carboxylesterase